MTVSYAALRARDMTSRITLANAFGVNAEQDGFLRRDERSTTAAWVQ